MSTCEKCWSDSAYSLNHADAYQELLNEREANGTACTPEEQAGEAATTCPACLRRTIHQWTGSCTACRFDPQKESA